MNDLFSLRDKVAIVIGGNGGIGKALVRGFAAMGASVVIAARNEAKTTERFWIFKKNLAPRYSE